MADMVSQAFAATLQTLVTPAPTVTQAVTTVANKAQKITWATRQKVKAQRVNRGGPIPNGPTCEELFAANIITIDGEYIAEVKAPSAGTTVTAAKQASSGLTAAQIRGMNRAQIAQHIPRKDLIALL